MASRWLVWCINLSTTYSTAQRVGVARLSRSLASGRRFKFQPKSDLRKFRLVVSRSHRPALLDAIIAAMRLQRERPLGSVGLKIGLIARQQADFYVHPNPGTKEWDTCAPDVILREAGGLMTDCWGRALRYNQPDIIRRFGVLASNRVCHPQISQIVAQVLDEAGVDPEFGF